jgi:Zn finger protein HypA/HybF involved in hydrogenase expression
MSFEFSGLSGWKPPDDYEEVQSSVPGITVFAPRPENSDIREKVKKFECPQCGADTKYNVSAGGVACEHCGYVASIEVKHVGTSAEQFEFTLETVSEAEQGWGVKRQELHCNNCGAEITLVEGEISTNCPFCTSSKVNIQTAKSDVLRPRFLVPFKIKPEETGVKEWLGKGWFHPKELSSSSNVKDFSGIYMPFWTFDADIFSRWEAEVGHEESESYYDSDTKEHKTKTEIHWQWKKGHVSLNIDDLLINGSSHTSRIILEKLYPFDMNGLVEYNPDFLAGWKAQAYDVTLTKAWDEGKSVIRNKAKGACYSDTGSSHIRNFSMTADMSGEKWRYILLPVYISAYMFKNKVYQIMVNGQTGKVAGQRPVIWWHVWSLIVLMLLPGGLLGLIGLPLLFLGGVGIVPLILGFILLIFGIIGSVWLHNYAVNEEAA